MSDSMSHVVGISFGVVIIVAFLAAVVLVWKYSRDNSRNNSIMKYSPFFGTTVLAFLIMDAIQTSMKNYGDYGSFVYTPANPTLAALMFVILIVLIVNLVAFLITHRIKVFKVIYFVCVASFVIWSIIFTFS